jgi:arylsulfatase A-like enzyme
MQGFMHAVDWFPTLLDIANIDSSSSSSSIGDIDGVSLKSSLLEGEASIRDGFIYGCYTNVSTPYLQFDVNASCGIRQGQ